MIRVYTGPMFANKSYNLIMEYYRNINENKNNIICFKPSKDNRDKSRIKSRATKMYLEAYVIKDLDEINKYLTPEIDTIIIDEIQFITGDVSELLRTSIMNNIDIYIAGLDLTSELKPFGIMPNILAIADEIYKCESDCKDCNDGARYTYCLVKKEEDILVGNMEYIPLCKECFKKKINNS